MSEYTLSERIQLVLSILMTWVRAVVWLVVAAITRRDPEWWP